MHRALCVRSFQRTACAFAAFGVLCAARIAAGAIIITAPNISLPYSATVQSGSFEVYLQNPAGPDPQVGAALLELQAPAASGVTFTVPANATTVDHPYLFTGSMPTTNTADAGATFLATDYADQTLPTAVDGAGLVLVDYTVAAGATGVIPLTLIPYPQGHIGTGLFDGGNNQIAAQLQSGSIAILAPEPSTLCLAVAALVGVFTAKRVSKSRRT